MTARFSAGVAKSGNSLAGMPPEKFKPVGVLMRFVAGSPARPRTATKYRTLLFSPGHDHIRSLSKGLANAHMDSIFDGDLSTAKGRAVAWIDSLFIDHAVFRLVWSNLAPVVPGKIYRCNHPTPARLRRMAARLGLRTLINLRGKTQSGSDALSRETARELGLSFHDMAFESRGAPQRDRIMRLHAIYTSMQMPAIMHCKSGADRAGLVAGLMVLFEGGSAEDALRQLSLRFGHIRQAKTGILDAFFLRYQREGEGRKPFLNWVQDDYDEAALRRDFHANGLASFISDWVLAHE
jgi:protein tyrosine/serine phosphatase